MDLLLDSNSQLQFSDDDVLCVNRTRLYLRVNALSDIVDASGRFILLHAWLCTTRSKRHPAHLWPNQTRPGRHTVSVWQKFLQTLCTSKHRQLSTPLGAWLRRPISTSFDTWFHPASNLVAITDQNYWSIHETTSSCRQGRKLGPVICTVPALDTDVWDPTECSHRYAGPSYVTIAPTFSTASATAPPPVRTWQQILLRYKTFHYPQAVLAAILNDASKTIIIVSDGGAESASGTYGWNITCNKHLIVDGPGKTWGGPMSSYRAEAFGKLAWLTLLKAAIEIGKESIKCNIISYCDNMGIVQSTSPHNNYTPPLCADYDVINEINETQRFLIRHGVKLCKTIHIQGHQDSVKPTSQLSWPAQMNVQADSLATQAKSNRYSQPINWPFDNCDAFLTQRGDPVSSKEIYLLQWNWCNVGLRNYYVCRFKLSHDAIDLINWPGLALARRRLRRDSPPNS